MRDPEYHGVSVGLSRASFSTRLATRSRIDTPSFRYFRSGPWLHRRSAAAKSSSEKKHYGIPIPWKHWTESITHLSWLHELWIVAMAGLGLGGTGGAPVFSASPRRRNQFF